MKKIILCTALSCLQNAQASAPQSPRVGEIKTTDQALPNRAPATQPGIGVREIINGDKYMITVEDPRYPDLHVGDMITRKELAEIMQKSGPETKHK